MDNYIIIHKLNNGAYRVRVEYNYDYNECVYYFTSKREAIRQARAKIGATHKKLLRIEY